MKTDLGELQNSLRQMLASHAPTLQLRVETEKNLEFAGTKEVMQGKQKVQGHYFASIMPKPKDVRFYFFPIYTHVDKYDDVSEEVRKLLKGKSCFHIKKLSEEAEAEIGEMIARGVALYQQDGLI